MKTLILSLLLIPGFVFALEVDEKLTIRIVKSSESRKTIMVNRGTEDGLVEGDHAKFIVTAGIVARAVCVKVSPTRSVWSIYRLVNADFINNDAVMTLKISPAVKITKDDSQMLVRDDTPTKVAGDATTIGIPLAEGAQDISPEDQSMSEEDLRALEEERSPKTITEKNIEVLGFLNISALSASSKGNGRTYQDSQSTYHASLGGEYYAKAEREWFSRFSLIGLVSMMRLSSQAYNGASNTTDVTELSVGTNWHPFALPSEVSKFIPFFHLSASMGTAKSSFSPGSESPVVAPGGSVVIKSGSTTGSTSGFALGFGYKFYTHNGFGVRALLDYYMRSEKYKSDGSNNSYNKNVAGPRLMLGLSYRF